MNQSDTPSKVINFTAARQQRLSEKRQNTERILFKNLLSVYLLHESGRAHPVQLQELSREGCSIIIPDQTPEAQPQSLGPHLLRFYLGIETYFEITILIKNTTPMIDHQKKSHRYGCAVDQETQSYEVYQQFVAFLKIYSENAKSDLGKYGSFFR